MSRFEEAYKELTTVCYAMDRELEETVLRALKKQIANKISDGKYCGHCECGNIVFLDMKYCPNCGQKIEWRNDG